MEAGKARPARSRRHGIAETPFCAITPDFEAFDAAGAHPRRPTARWVFHRRCAGLFADVLQSGLWRSSGLAPLRYWRLSVLLSPMCRDNPGR